MFLQFMASKAVRFEVIGKVQGVFFRKYTKKMCDKHGLSGWVLNTNHGSVQGYMEGTPSGISKVKDWLKTKGSPKSRVDNCKFFDESPSGSYSHFSIIRDEEEVDKRTFKA